MRKTVVYTLAVLAALPATVEGRRHSPYEGPRIYWDIDSKKTVFGSGSYARIIELQDGRLLAVGESGGGISINWSDDSGLTWGEPQKIVANENMLPFAVPDVIQLANGDIVVGYNPRPSEPYSTDRRFGIRCVRSTDNGLTWSDRIVIYNASHVGGEGCWEPCFLELPSGELQCYFANENNFPTSGEQEISMCRSFDGGLTWSGETRISFSPGSRDGMPVPILTDSGEIVVIIEDNGWPGYGGFRATTVRTTLENNWSDWVPRNSRRQMIFADEADKGYISAAPYMRRLGAGATIASWQGDRPPRQGMGETYFDMYVGVGDADGRNVRAIVAPFGLPVDQHGLWNSVTALRDGKTVFAVSSVGTWGGQALCAMTGYAIENYESPFGSPAQGQEWTEQVLLGAVSSRQRSAFDFMYDAGNLYLHATVSDMNAGAGDGVAIALDMADACDSYPQPGMYRMFFGADGTASLQVGKGNKWVDADFPSSVEFSIDKKRNEYVVDAAIPWGVLGCDTAPDGVDIRCYLEVRDARSDGRVVVEAAPDANPDSSWTWPMLKLLPDGRGDPEETYVSPMEASETFEPVYYDLTGQKVSSPIPGRLYILRTPATTIKIIK